jgi:predicted  nucleic acid-binding Zn-ribbon protein
MDIALLNELNNEIDSLINYAITLDSPAVKSIVAHLLLIQKKIEMEIKEYNERQMELSRAITEFESTGNWEVFYGIY